MGTDLDVERSSSGIIETHLPIAIPCGYNPLPQLHRGARDPARAMFNLVSPDPNISPALKKAITLFCISYPNPGIRVSNVNTVPDLQTQRTPESSAVTMSATPS